MYLSLLIFRDIHSVYEIIDRDVWIEYIPSLFIHAALASLYFVVVW